MKSLRIGISLLTSTVIWSCQTSNSTKSTEVFIQSDTTYIDTSDVVIGKKEVSDKAKNEVVEDTITNINFEELSISINRLVVFDEGKKLNQTQRDTVYLYSELGETIEGQTISISADLLADLTIEQCYETSVTIMGEGPHCDLINWKHYNSKWKILKINKAGQFICDSYSEKESEKFPEIQISELKAKVKEQCGNEFYNPILKIKVPTEYPSGVGISRYFLRLTGQRKDNRQKVTKFVIFEVAMGC